MKEGSQNKAVNSSTLRRLAITAEKAGMGLDPSPMVNPAFSSEFGVARSFRVWSESVWGTDDSLKGYPTRELTRSWLVDWDTESRIEFKCAILFSAECLYSAISMED